MEVKVTGTQMKILKYVAKSIDETGVQPSYRDMCVHFGWASPNMPACCIDDLEKKGIVTKRGSRAIEFDWRYYLERRIGK